MSSITSIFRNGYTRCFMLPEYGWVWVQIRKYQDVFTALSVLTAVADDELRIQEAKVEAVVTLMDDPSEHEIFIEIVRNNLLRLRMDSRVVSDEAGWTQVEFKEYVHKHGWRLVADSCADNWAIGPWYLMPGAS